ncbi:MAG: HlyC/CorC family transporter [Clostridia bacterium]|nr:HlyC/CorC family transporter [Clostridia bacterium]
MDPALQIVIIIFCIVMSAYFSATETAFSTFNRIRVKNLAEKGNKKAVLVMKLADNYDTLISTILIGNNIVNILASSLTTLLFVEWLSSGSLAAFASAISTAVLTIVILTFGEISPKTVAKKIPESFAMFSAPLINLLLIIFFPLTIVFKGLQTLLGKIFKSDGDQGMTEEELISIIEEAEEEGDFDKEESTLIKSAIEFGDLEVGDIFTPRIDITAIPRSATAEEIKRVFNESGYSRLPVYEGDLDNVIGILNHKDFFSSSFEDGKDVTELTKPVMYVTKTQKINDLLRELQKKQRHIAIVTDEYGSTAGLVSLEDILEEIVGDIWDEHDEIVEEIKEVGEGEYIVSGKANIEKLFDELDIEEDDEIDALTVNGWAMEALGRIPEVGDSFEADGLSVEVLEMDGRRIENLHITDIREDEDDED